MYHILILFLIYFNIFSFSFDHRPRYHFTPRKNWMNDPNGPFYFNKKYHLFFQHNPNASVWGDMHWGHIISKDLLSWTQMPIALSPDTSYDHIGVFSGSTTIVNNKPIISYTGVYPQSQCFAYPQNLSDPNLIHWVKDSHNPIISEPPGRDPTTAWYVHPYWYMALGWFQSSILFRSLDFKNWEFRDYLHRGNEGLKGEYWEMPDFFPVPGYKNIWVYKIGLDLLYRDTWLIGTFDNITENFKILESDHFLGDIYSWVDHGNFYGGKTFYDPQYNRQLLYGWVNEEDDTTNYIKRGWAGVLALPRIITLSSNKRQIISSPIPEIHKFRHLVHQFQNITLPANRYFEIPEFRDTQYEIETMFDISQLHRNSLFEFGFKVLLDDNDKTFLKIKFQVLAFHNQTNIEFIGGDYQNTHQENYLQCAQLCEIDSNCSCWSFSPDFHCKLKNNFHPLKISQGWYSGINSKLRILEVTINETPGYFFPTPHNSPFTSSNGKYVEKLGFPLKNFKVRPHRGIMKLPLDQNNFLVNIFIDHSIVEIFINNGVLAITGRFYAYSHNNRFATFIRKRDFSSLSDEFYSPISMSFLKIYHINNTITF